MVDLPDYVHDFVSAFNDIFGGYEISQNYPMFNDLYQSVWPQISFDPTLFSGFKMVIQQEKIPDMFHVSIGVEFLPWFEKMKPDEKNYILMFFQNLYDNEIYFIT